MSKYLVLVESPSKAKTINKYLGRNYKVEATVGHIRNLPKTKLGVDFENDFALQFLNIRGKGDVIKKIKKLAAKSEKIFIATDPDREGEAIAQDIVEVINGKTKAKIFRILFNEITKTTVKEAIKNPLELDIHLVSSQRARRAMDRIIGYKISPLLWRALLEDSGNSLSAGRVQSVALRLICEREEKIDAFVATEHWNILAEFENKNGSVLKTKLNSVEGRTLKVPPKPEMTDKEFNHFLEKNFAIRNNEEAEKIIIEVKQHKSFEVSSIDEKDSKRNPAPPFITSTMQAEASRRLRYRPRRTMQIAQSLYEGVELGEEGFTGLITYMRTDSTRINGDFINDARTFIEDKYGKKYKPSKPRVYTNKKSNVQDAHEAIRPTSMKYTPDFVKNYLNEDQLKLYTLVWNRFTASQMESALVATTTVKVKVDKYEFQASGTVIKFDGYLVLYEEGKEDNGNDKVSDLIPADIKEKQKLSLDTVEPTQHFTKPPPRYTESTLIKELESNGIGRPSTYALIIGTISDRNYIETIERKLFPTDLGKKVNVVLIKNFNELLNVNFTAQMEEELDQIASGSIEYTKAMNDFYIPFSKVLSKVEESIEKIICEKCGSEMDIKIGRFGKFLACTNYPDCKNIKSLKEMNPAQNEPELTGEKCPKCKGNTVLRNGKFGKFIGCENYPECDYTQQITTGIKCPKCKNGDVVTRRSKRGKYFFGCSNYPDCDYISWTKPTSEAEAVEQK